MDKVTKRIERELKIPNLLTSLSELSPTDLQSLLLDVYKNQSRQKRPADVLSDYEKNRFVRPSRLSSKRLLELNQVFLSNLSDFSILELSPVCPLGTSSVIANVDQNWAVSTSRNTEVISDATNVLALECAVRRKEILRQQPKSTHMVHLAASHRFLRPQFYDNPALSPHFQMFSLCSAGRDQGNLGFECAALFEHIQFYLKSMIAFLEKEVLIEVRITDFHTSDYSHQIGLFDNLRAEFPHVSVVWDNERASGKNYYQNLCFKIYAQGISGQWIELADGGSVNWTAVLLNSAKERLIISGISSERLCIAFE